MGVFIRRANSDQQGITGLETAIILIAFVMVASVFSYVVLSAGLFSSQKAKEAVHAGLEEVRSTMELKGDVLAQTDNGTVTNISFFAGGTTLLGSVRNPPANVSINVTNLAAGNYTLTAVAKDNAGASTTSASPMRAAICSAGVLPKRSRTPRGQPRFSGSRW